MGYPTESRHKILQQQVQDAESIASPSASQRPQAIPGLVVGYLTRTDGGQCLKVIPLAPLTTSPHGELTFFDGSNVIPSNAGSLYYIKVYPIDVVPSDVPGSFPVGKPIMVYPYWGGGSNTASVRGTYVCVKGAPDMQVVSLRVNGGADGDAATGNTATWCYDLIELEAGKVLATQVPLYTRRILAVTTNAALYGLAFTVSEASDIGEAPTSSPNNGQGFGPAGPGSGSGSGSTSTTLQPWRLYDAKESFGQVIGCNMADGSDGGSGS